MENINEALKLIAKTKEILKNFIEEREIGNIGEIEDAVNVLEEAIDKLAVPKVNSN